MKKFLLIILAVIFLVFICFWFASYYKYETLTNKYGAPFAELYKETNMIDEIDYYKVMEYSENNATVYYVTRNAYGNLMYFEKKADQWELKSWITVWSSSGSASGFMWPYLI